MSLIRYVGQLARLIRLPNSFTVISNVLAAHVIGMLGGFHMPTFISVVVASLCFYHGGIVLNDCLDIKEDRVTQPNRPIPSGAIALPIAWAFVVYFFIFGLALAYTFGQTTFTMAVLLVISIIAYNVSPRSGLVGCVFMGLCRALNWLFVLAAVDVMEYHNQFAWLVGFYVVALTLISRDEHYANRPWLVKLSLCVIMFALSYFVYFMWLDNRLNWPGLVALVVGASLIIRQLFGLLKDYNSEHIQKTVMVFIIGLIPLDAVLVLNAGYPIVAIGLLVLILPSKFLAKRLYVT